MDPSLIEVLNTKIKKEVLDNHISFWLNWDDQTLLDRIQNSKKRPVAFKASKEQLIELIKKRSIVMDDRESGGYLFFIYQPCDPRWIIEFYKR